MTALALREVWKARGKGVRAVSVLRGASVVLERGEIALLEGPSGSGKTTLLALAAGLLTADRGSVELAGKLLSELTPAECRAHRARAVGFVFQRANLLTGLTAQENVLLAAELAQVPRDAARLRCDRLFADLGIAPLKGRSVEQLSGGEEHRVAVARALIHEPAVVLADEPTGNLDAESGRAVMEALGRLVVAQGSALLVATHDPRLRQLSDRVLTLEAGLVHDAAGSGYRRATHEAPRLSAQAQSGGGGGR